MGQKPAISGCLIFPEKATIARCLNAEQLSCFMLKRVRIFVTVISKEGLAGTSPAKPSYGMAPAIKYNL